MKENKVLNTAFQTAKEIVNHKKDNPFSKDITNKVDIIVEKIGNNKSLVGALVTSFVKKL